MPSKASNAQRSEQTPPGCAHGGGGGVQLEDFQPPILNFDPIVARLQIWQVKYI
eukprot:COSAG06_NODE_71550_length_182_cov_89.180723_1_plen_53_part_01